MAETSGLWDLLTQTANGEVVAALKEEVATSDDRALNRINPLAFAVAHGLNEEAVIATLVHAARLGLFDMSWNMLCPGCGGVLQSGVALKSINRSDYFCSLCVTSCEPTLDELVEVTFTVNSRIRKIAAHDPDSLPIHEYARQIYFSSAIDPPEDLNAIVDKASLDMMELNPGERAAMSLTLAPGQILLFDPVSHTTMFFEVVGDETKERRGFSVAFGDAQVHKGSVQIAPGPVRIALENTSSRRVLPMLWRADEDLHAVFSTRRPYVTATRLLSNQTFRDLYRTATLDSEQRFKITSLTILFTDLRGSTALYDRVGDLAAFDLVRSHFGELLSAVSAEGGAVVKTIGDAVMATFSTPDRAIRAAMSMRDAMRRINEKRGSEDLALNIGLHTGPCLAVTLDDRQDYFGMAVNVASRVQSLAEPDAILATKPVVESPEVMRLVESAGYRTASKLTSLRGVTEQFEIFEIREPDRGAAKAA